MLKRKNIAVFLYFTLSVIWPAAAQQLPFAQRGEAPVQKVEQIAEAKEGAYVDEMRQRAYYAYPVGKTFWYQPGRERRVRFYGHVERSAYSSKLYLVDELILSSTITFKVLEQFELPRTNVSPVAARFYRIKFDDGKTAFVPENDFGEYQHGKPIASQSRVFTTDASVAIDLEHDHVFIVDPKPFLAANAIVKEHQAIADEAGRVALARTRGVKVGMSKAEVKQSSWGEPSRVNRITNGSGVFEQWVYSNGSLYFMDGVLTTIQD
jgi:hypothetical protein